MVSARSNINNDSTGMDNQNNNNNNNNKISNNHGF